MRKKYYYTLTCPSCGVVRKTLSKGVSGGRCRTCAGKETYVKPSSERNNKRKLGDGYITKQGYRLVYSDGKYVPAHRAPFLGKIKDSDVVHHVDGNKLNNKLSNLFACSKKEHRELHGQLERLSYYLIQNGLINFEEGKYTFSTSMKEFIDANSVNSGEALSVDIEGNPEPSPPMGRCNDYPEREYTQASGSAENPTE